MENNNQLQVANQQKQYLKIYKAGKTIEEIESVCSLSTVNFFDTILKIDKIKTRKNENGFNSLIGAVLTKASILCGINTEIDNFTKQDSEKFPISVDFSTNIASGDSIVVKTVTALRTSDSVDVTTGVIADTLLVSTANTVYAVVEAGTDAQNYKITTVAYTTNGYIYEHDVMMLVRNE